MTSSWSFSRLATVTASTKRAPAFSGGKRGEPSTNIASLKCTPLDPVGADDIRRLNLNTPGRFLETFIDGGLDIKKGDRLVVDGIEYPMKAVEKFTWRRETSAYHHVIVEQLDAAE